MFLSALELLVLQYVHYNDVYLHSECIKVRWYCIVLKWNMCKKCAKSSTTISPCYFLCIIINICLYFTTNCITNYNCDGVDNDGANSSYSLHPSSPATPSSPLETKNVTSSNDTLLNLLIYHHHTVVSESDWKSSFFCDSNHFLSFCFEYTQASQTLLIE